MSLKPHTTFLSFLNDILTLDCYPGSTWKSHKGIGEAPKPRSDTELVYDKKGNRIILFGGWSQRWFGDTCALNVGEIVGNFNHRFLINRI